MDYAIVRIGGKQYKVKEKEIVLIDKLEKKKGEEVNFPEVLLIKQGDNVYIGDPFVKDGEVKGKVIDQVKGEKIAVLKFKAKVRYRRKMGFRPLFTKVLIEEIRLRGKNKTSRKGSSKEKSVKKS